MVENVGAPRTPGTIPFGTSGDAKIQGSRSEVPRGVGDGAGAAPPASAQPSESGSGAPLPSPLRSRTADPASVSFTLSQFASNAPSIQQIAQIIQDANLQARTAARQDRAAARDVEISSQLDAADKIRDQANFNLGATIVTSTLAIAGAAMTIGGALKAQQIRSDGLLQAEPLELEADKLWSSAKPDSSATSAALAALEEPKLDVPGTSSGTPNGLPQPAAELEARLVDNPTQPASTPPRLPPPPPRPTMDDLDAMLEPDPPENLADVPQPDYSHLDLPDITEPAAPGGAQGSRPLALDAELGEEPAAPSKADPTQPVDAKAARAEAARLDKRGSAIVSEAEGRATTLDKAWSGRGVIITEMGKLAGASLQRAGAEKEAEKAELEAKASTARTKAEDQTDFIRAYTDNVRAIQEKLAAMQQAEADTMRTIIRA